MSLLSQYALTPEDLAKLQSRGVVSVATPEAKPAEPATPKRDPQVKAANAAYMKKRRADLLARDLCVSCAKRAPVEGKSQCQACRQRAIDWVEENVNKPSRARGCTDCSAPRPNPRSPFCDSCREKRHRASIARWKKLNRKRCKAQRKKRLKQGRCVRCGKPREDLSVVHCTGCTTQRKQTLSVAARPSLPATSTAGRSTDSLPNIAATNSPASNHDS